MNREEIRFNFTWLDISGNVIADTPQTSIHYPVESVSVLSLFPLSVLHTNISCEVVIDSQMESDYVLASPAAMEQGFLTIQCELKMHVLNYKLLMSIVNSTPNFVATEKLKIESCYSS